MPQASQTIAGLQIGTRYEIDWDAKTHYYSCNNPTTPGDGVAIDGNQFDFLIVNGQPWTSYSRQFTYSGGSNVLVLSSQRNGTDSDAEFDNVSITAVQSAAPEPGSALLLGVGIAAIVAGRRRK